MSEVAIIRGRTVEQHKALESLVVYPKIARRHISPYLIPISLVVDFVPMPHSMRAWGEAINNLIEIDWMPLPVLIEATLSVLGTLMTSSVNLRLPCSDFNIICGTGRVPSFGISQVRSHPYTNLSPNEVPEKSQVTVISIREGMCQNGHWSGAPCMAHPLHNALGYWRSSARFLVR